MNRSLRNVAVIVCATLVVPSMLPTAASSATSGVGASTSRTSTTAKTSTPAKPPTEQTVLRIAAIVPLSGPAAADGEDVLAAMRLAIRHSIEDRVVPEGTDVRIQVLDETSTAAIAALDRSLRGGTLTAIGGLLPRTTGRYDDVLRANGALMLRVAGANPLPNSSSEAPRSAPSTASGAPPVELRFVDDIGARAARYATRVRPGSTVVLVSDSSPTATHFIEGFERGVPAGSAVVSVRVGRDRLSPTELEQLVALQPSDVILALPRASLVTVMRAIRDASPTTNVTFLGSPDGSSCVRPIPDALLDGDRCVVTSSFAPTSTSGRAFVEDARAARIPLGEHSAVAYAATRAALRIAQTSSGDATQRRRDLFERLPAVREPGAAGALSFDANGRRIGDDLRVLRRLGRLWLPE